MRRLLPLFVLLLLAAGPPSREPALPALPGSLRLSKSDRYLAFHKQGICGVGFSPDGKIVATSGGDFRVRLWDVTTGKWLRTFSGHKNFLRIATFSPDGKLVASGGNDPGIWLWDPATGKEVRRLAGHPGHVYHVVFTPDGKTLISGGFDAQVRIWDVATGKQLRAWPTHRRVVYAIGVSPDGTTVATGGDDDTTIALWDVATGKQLRSWSAHKEYVMDVAFSPNGRWLASGGGEDIARVWEVATGKEIRQHPGHDGGVGKVVFSPDSRVLYTAARTKSVLAFDVLSGKELFRVGEHAATGWIWGMTRSPDGRLLASAGHDGTAIVWDIASRLRPPATETVTLTAKECDALWTDLASDDATQAFRAIYRLSRDAKQAVPYLRKHLRPAAIMALDTTRVAQFIDDLDSDTFETREKASAELDRLCPATLPMLRKALTGTPSLEARRRMERLISKHERSDLSTDEIRMIRAIHALEECATAEAQALLKVMTTGAREARLTQEAEAALKRVTK